MYELVKDNIDIVRRDYYRDRRTIIAPARAGRLKHADALPPRSQTLDEPSCGFCPGREDETPPATLVWPARGAWQIRAFPNLYPIVPEAHEVIVETPLHGATLASLGVAHVELVLSAWEDRIRAQYRNREVAWSQVFKNQGAAAGASLGHAHSQVVGLPFLPADVEEKRRHSEQGKCAYCDIAVKESSSPRVVVASRFFVGFCPVAPVWNGEIWVVARPHLLRLPTPGSLVQHDLAAILCAVLRAVETVTPAYNLMVYSSAPDAAMHLHIEITPRQAHGLKAGLELATGVSVVRESPEATAETYRALLTKQSRGSGSLRLTGATRPSRG